jgi:hypothetical protein
VFTLNVLAAAIFNKNYPFEGDKSELNAQDDSYRYRDSLSTIISSIVQIFIFGEKGLKAWWTPKSWKDAAVAIGVFRSYILGLINEEREHASRGIEHNQHLVAALIRACEVETRAQSVQPGHRNMSLTETEIISNLFMYAFAGNDTTAIVLGHLLIDLAAHPETQDWIAEEIHHYLPGDDFAQWDYHTFPKMKRCLAVVVYTTKTVERKPKLIVSSTKHLGLTTPSINWSRQPKIKRRLSTTGEKITRYRQVPTYISVSQQFTLIRNIGGTKALLGNRSVSLLQRNLESRTRFWPRTQLRTSCHGLTDSGSVQGRSLARSSLLLP